MGRFIIIACTNVGRYMIEEVMNNSSITSKLLGVVNLDAEQGLNKANYDSYSDLAIKYAIDIKYCKNINDEEILMWIKEKSPDIIIQSGWSQKFSSKLLSIPKYYCIGEHPAPLPRGRGAACVNWAILNGEKQWGDSFFEMMDEYDKGCIFAQNHFMIEDYDSVYTIYEKVAKSSCDIIRKYIDKWTNGIFDKKNQDDTDATYYKRRKPTDGEIKDFNIPAKTIHNFVRAQTIPYPCAYIILNGKKMKLLQTECSGEFSDKPAGTVLNTYETEGAIGISCENGEILKIVRVQVENSPSCWGKDCLELRKKIGNSIF